MSARDQLVLVKWGGSLITDKSRVEHARSEVMARLAGELAELAREYRGRLMLGHGSGSFGHQAAQGTALGAEDGRVNSVEQLAGVSAVQDQAARLHRLVIGALRKAEAAPFSLVPGSFMVAADGNARMTELGSLIRALALGFLPVVFGDVILDRERGATIFSTERVFLTLARDLTQRGHAIGRAFWLGETDGIYDDSGTTVEIVKPEDLADLRRSVGGSAGADVTGGMGHRLDSALALAAFGIESWILDGRRPGILARALAGEAVGGTRVLPQG